MSRAARIFASLSMFLAATPLSAPVLAAQAMDGWHGYTFGMSPDAARAVPGQVFGPFSPKNLADENVGTMGAKNDVQLFGRPYKLNLFFNDRQKLNDISLETQTKSVRQDCEITFLTLLGQLEQSYGSFAPVNPQHAKTDGDQLAAAIEWRKQGASGYQLSTVYMDGETASAWKARKVTGADFVDIAVTWSGDKPEAQFTCLIDIDFAGK